MLPLLRSVSGLDAASVPELLKYFTTVVGGKWSARIVVLMSTIYLFAPDLPHPWSDRASRLLMTCLGYLIAIMFYRSAENAKLLRTTIAIQTVTTPGMPNVSTDPGVQREIAKLDATASGSRPTHV
jgi:hypothetical protein